MSVDIATLGLEVRSDGVVVASDRLKKLTDEGRKAETSTNSLASSTDKLAGYLKAAAAALAAWKLTEYIKDATLLAARVETLGVVLRVVGNNAGYTGTQMEAYVAQVKKMGITTQESMNSLIKMAGAQMDLSKASQLARVAQDAAVIGNINSSEAFGRLIQGIRSGEVEILKTIGINVQFEQGYKQTAATLGKTTDALTSAEKTASRMNQVLQFGTNIAGAYEASMGTAGKQILSMSRFTEELKLSFGALGLPTLTVLVGELTAALKQMNEQAANNKSAFAELGDDMGDFVSDTLSHLKQELTAINALILDMKSGLYLLGAVAATPGRVAGDGLYDTMMDRSRAYAEAARNARDYAAAVKAADNGQPAIDPSDQKNLYMARSAREDRAIAAANSAQKAQKEKADAEALAHAIEKAAESVRRWTATYADLRKEIGALNPTMTEQERVTDEVNNKYADLINKKGANISLLKQLQSEHLKAVTSFYSVRDAISATSDEFKEYLQLAESETPKNNAAGEMSLRWEEELKALESLQPSADLTKLNEQISQFEKLLEDIPEKAPEVAAAIKKLKEEFAQSSGLKSLLAGNIELETSLIYDTRNPNSQFEMEKRALTDRYNLERELQKQALEDSEANAEKGAAIVKRLNLLQQKYIKDTAKVQEQANLSMRERTVDMGTSAANVFAAMADAQNTSSKEGFEAAKKMNAAATITATAAAVMNQMSGGDPYTAWARAAAAAAMGAVQLANILKTDYEGGGSISGVSGGSVGSGGGRGNAESGGTLGYRVQSVQDMQAADSLQRLAEASDNASMAIGRVADSLTSIADIFGTESAKELSGSLAVDGSRLWGSFINQTQLNYGGSGITATRAGGNNPAPISAETLRGLNSYLATVQQNIIRSAIAIGTSADIGAAGAVPSRIISTQGRTPEEIQKDIEAFFTEVANALAKTTEGLEAYRFAGEGQYDTLMRLATSLQTVNELFELTGHRLVDSSLAGADAAYRLAEAFGGLDKMSDAVNSYFEGMFTEQERNARILWQDVRQVNVAFSEMGLAVPSSTEAFRQLVDSLDVTTQSGASLYVSLMSVAPTFAEMIKLSNEFTEASRKYGMQLRDLQMREMELKGGKDSAAYRELLKAQREAEASAMDASLAAIQKRIWALEDEKAAAEATATAASGILNTALAAANTLKQIQGNAQLSNKSPEKLYQDLRGEFVSAMSDPARYGDASAIAQDFLNASRAYNASGASYNNDYNMVTQALKNISGMTTEPTLAALDKQIDLLQKISDTLSEGNLSQASALVPQIASWSWLAVEMSKLFGIPQHASGGYYAGGLALMGERGAELVDSTPGYVYRAEETKALFEMAKRGVAADNYSAEMVAEIRELRRDVAALKGTAETGNRIAAAVGSELAEIGQEGNRQRAQVVKGERMRGAA